VWEPQCRNGKKSKVIKPNSTQKYSSRWSSIKFKENWKTWNTLSTKTCWLAWIMLRFACIEYRTLGLLCIETPPSNEKATSLSCFVLSRKECLRDDDCSSHERLVRFRLRWGYRNIDRSLKFAAYEPHIQDSIRARYWSIGGIKSNNMSRHSSHIFWNFSIG